MKHLLIQYSDLIMEREEICKRIKKIEKKLELINSEGDVKDAVKGGAGGWQTFIIDGFPVIEWEENIYLLKKAKRELSIRENKIAEQTADVEKYLNTLDDSRMRRMITKKYIENKPWSQVAYEMGKMYTEESCRKQMERFLKKL